MGWFDLSTLKEPYRLEGKKTMGLELAEQLGWTLPDVILYPTGGGTGLDRHVEGVRRNCAELGWICRSDDERCPRLDRPCQAEGCAPIVHGVREGRAVRRTVPERADGGQRAARAGRGRRLHDARRDPRQRRHGGGRARGDDRRVDAAGESAEGISICPETAVCFDVLEKLVASRRGEAGRGGRGVQHRGRAEVPRSDAGRAAVASTRTASTGRHSVTSIHAVAAAPRPGE